MKVQIDGFAIARQAVNWRSLNGLILAADRLVVSLTENANRLATNPEFDDDTQAVDAITDFLETLFPQ